jgi:hypothetical protein
MAHLHLWQYPIFQYRDFCTLLQWELSWGAKSLLTASAKSAGNTFNNSPQQNYYLLIVLACQKSNSKSSVWTYDPREEEHVGSWNFTNDSISCGDDIILSLLSCRANFNFSAFWRCASALGDVFWDDQQHHTSLVLLSIKLMGGGGTSSIGDNKGHDIGGDGEGHGCLGALENKDVGCSIKVTLFR